MARVIGTSRQQIVAAASKLLTDDAEYQAMTAGLNPYGDGHAAERIVEGLRRWAAGTRPLLTPEKEFQPNRRHRPLFSPSADDSWESAYEVNRV